MSRMLEALGYGEEGERLPRGSTIGIESIWDEGAGKWRRLATTAFLPLLGVGMSIRKAMQAGLFDRYGQFVWHVYERLRA